jgi:hypothetical protein
MKIFKTLFALGVFFIGAQIATAQVSIGGYTISSQTVADTSNVACTMDAMLCPDGITSVGRVAPTCAFAACPSTTSSLGCVALQNNLRVGSTDATTSNEVKQLQNFLIQRGYLSTQPTGRFLGMTQSAVIAFQRDQGISPISGIVGPITRARISSLTCNVSDPLLPVENENTSIGGVNTITIASVDPASARVGQSVTIRGFNLFRPETKLLFDGMSIPGRPVYERATGAFNSAFQFTVPDAIIFSECVRVKPTDPCPLAPARLVTPGLYTLAVENNLGRASVNFTVIGIGDVGVTQKPQLNSLTPSAGSVGTEVVIRGSNLNIGNDEVYFGGSLVSLISPSVSADTVGTLRFRVPADITPCGIGGQNLCRIASRPVTPGTYEVAVVNKNGTSNTLTFTVTTPNTTPAPVITSFAPTSVRPGDVITVNGTNFPAFQTVAFLFLTNVTTGAQLSAIGATHPESSPSRTQFTIPTTVLAGEYRVSLRFSGATQNVQATQTLRVTTNVNVTAPRINTISPTTASPGSDITLTGSDLNTGDPRVVLNDSIFIIPDPARANANTLVFRLPAVSYGTFNVRVVNGSGTSNAVTLNVVAPASNVPTISSLSPMSGLVGTRVVITGTNINTNEEAVTFGGSLNYVNIIQPRQQGRIEFIVPEMIGSGCPLFTTNTTCPPGAQLSVNPGTYEVAVVNRNGTSNRLTFTVTAPNAAPTPTIISFSPTPIQQGQTLTVNGINFPNFQTVAQLLLTNANSGAQLPFIGATHPESSPSRTQFTIPTTVPAGNYRLSVRFSGGTPSAQATQTLQVTNVSVVNPPQITGISPTNTSVGAQVTITGVRLGSSGDARIVLNDTGFIIPDSTRAQDGILTFVLPSSMSRYCLPGVICSDDMIPVTAGTYTVKVVNSSGISNAVNLTVSAQQSNSPVISSISPAAGATNSQVTLSGSNLSASSDFVWFQGLRLVPDRSVKALNVLVFTVPSTLVPPCTGNCLAVEPTPTPLGFYDVKVESASGVMSNILRYNVTSNSSTSPF